MKTLKQVCKKNWYIIVATLLLAICSEVLLGIMVFDKRYFNSAEEFSFYGGIIVLRFFLLFAGVVVTYISINIFRMKYSASIATVLMVFATICQENELNALFNYYSLCFVAAMISLAFYYVSYCKESIVHTILYMVEISVLCYTLFYEIEFYMVVLMHVFLVVTNNNSIKRKSVKVINWIFTGVSSAMLISTFVIRLINQMEYRYMDISDAEGLMEIGYNARETTLLLEKMMIATEDFATSEFFGEFANESYAYNLAKIFGYYGNFVGVVMVMLVVAFFTSVLIGCSKKQEKMKPALGATVIILMVRIISAFLINFGFISILESHMPFLTLCTCGGFLVGLILGIIFAADKETVFKENKLSYER